jgi:dihydrofolate reductase
MRTITVEVETSLDGAMGGANVEFWTQLFQFHTPDVTTYLHDLLFGADALLIGRKTYEGFATVWPTRQGADADFINAMPKYIASRTLTEPLRWNAALIKGDVAREIRALKEQPGKSLMHYGVGELTRTMLDAGLVDELRVLVNPFTFGEGPHIADYLGARSLALLDATTFTSGVVALRYQPRH